MNNKIKNSIYIILIFFMLISIVYLGYVCCKPPVCEMQFSQEDFYLGADDTVPEQETAMPGFYLDASMAGNALYSNEFFLKKGIYEVLLSADTNNMDRECCIEVIPTDDMSGGSHSHLLDSDSIGIKKDQPTIYRIHVNHDTGARIKASITDREEGSYILLDHAQITYLKEKTATWRISKRLFGYLIFVVLLGLFLYRKEKTLQFIEKNAYAITAVAGSTLIAMYPFFNHFLIFGDDMLYHLNRIVHLGEGFRLGMFPVRVHPGWAGEYGYAAGVGYCDLFLVPSAILYQFGYTLANAYRFYVWLMTVLTALLSQYAFGSISGDQKIGAICCWIYTLFPYRLYNVYTGATVGEFGAYTFLPLVVLGLYLLYIKKEKKGGLYLAIGISLILEAHILTTFILALVLPVFCIFMWKDTFRKEIFTELCKTVGIILLLNLWFILPLLDYMLLQGFQGTWTVYLWNNGFDITQLLFSVRDLSGYSGGTAGVGLISPCILFGSFILLCKKSFGTQNIKMGILWGSAVLLLFMSTTAFPYWSMHRYFPILDQILSNIQFPYRLINIAAVILTLILALSEKRILEDKGREAAYLFGALLLLLSMYQVTEYLTNVVNDGHYFTAYDEARIGEGNPVEFLLKDSALEVTGISAPESLSEDTTAVLTGREGLHITAQITNNGENASTVLFPLWAYRYYRARTEQGEYLPLSSHTDTRIAVEIPPHFAGNVDVYFKEPFIWRIAELISAGSLAALVIFCRKKRGKRTEENV